MLLRPVAIVALASLTGEELNTFTNCLNKQS